MRHGDRQRRGNGSTVVMGMSDDVLATDPASGYDPGSWLLFNNVFQSLLSFPKGATEPQPDAARACDFDTSTTVYTCTLRDGLKFSNGDDLTSEDVKFSFDRMLKIDDPDGPAVMFTTLDKVETPDSKTVVFRLKVPDATFPSKIASGAGSIVDHRQYDANGLRKDGQAVGSGPYKLDSFNDDQAVFSVNDQYKGTVEPKNSGVTLKFFHGDQSGLKKALLAGDVDIAYRGLTASDIAGLDQRDGTTGVEVVEGSSAEVQHLVFNMDDPVAGKLGVRKAIAYLIDREALIKDVHQGTATPCTRSSPPESPATTRPSSTPTAPAPARPRPPPHSAPTASPPPVDITLWSTPVRYGPATDAELKAIAGQLNASGLFRADVKSVPLEQYEKDIEAGKYGVYVKGWVPDYPDADNFTAPFFGPDNVLGNHYTNRTITGSLLPATAAQSDRAATEKEFGRLQDIVAAELPMLPVWQGKQYAVVRENVYGLESCLDASTVFRFWELQKD
ncbi:ABC transporter substrate-binding protein [Streptomyces thermocoprophilus]